jgi:cyclohexanecarboxylate-CoA ligase
VIYTSGTTGQPKGVMHTANSTLSHLNSWITHHKLGADDKIFMASPLAHQTGFLYAILMPVMLGVEVVLLDRWDAPVGVELIQKHGATFTMGATPFLSDIVEMPNVGNFDLSKLRTFVSAGAPIPPALVQKAAANFTFKVLSGWGMTECACPTICDPNDPDEKVWTSDGGCLPHSEVMVHGPDGKPLPQGEEGILKVRGQSMFVGYLKKPEMHGTDKDGWFDTGDQAFMHPDGYIRITGRAKDIIIRGGENIPVVEVEDVLYRHPSVAEVAVVGIPDDRMGELGCAFVTLQAGDSLDMAGMIRYLEETKTAKQYWPEHLEVIDEMPRTPSGKIQKFKLREMAKEFSR